MTTGPVGQKIVRFALPLFLGNIFQQLYNTADSLIVGNFVGSEALAAVSSSGNLIFMVTSFFIGIASGAGVLIGSSLGAGDRKRTETTVHTTVAFGIICSIIMTLIGIFLAPPILILMQTPEDVLPLSITYFRVYFAGAFGFVMYNTFVGILQAAGDSRHPLYYLIFSSVVNIILDLLFVGPLQMGVAGAALATDISQIASALLCFVRLVRTDADYRIVPKKIRIEKRTLSLVLGQGLPAGLQNSVMGLSNVVIQSYINAYGTAAVAGIGAYIKIEGFVFIPITSFALAITTFVSQNRGAGQKERIKDGVRFGLTCTLVIVEILGLLLAVFSPQMIYLFDRNAEVIHYGVMRARIVTPFFFLCAYTHAMSGVLRGLGKPIPSLLAFLLCWCVVRVAGLAIVELFVHTIMTTYIIYPATWTLSSLFLFFYYRHVKKTELAEE